MLLSDVRYSAWANRLLLEACAALTVEEIARDLHVSHASILSTLCHFYDGERVWLDRLRTPPESGPWRLPQGPAPKLSLDELRRRWPDLWDGYLQLLEGSSEADFDIKLPTLLPHGLEVFSWWEILRHALDHSTLHRGQVVGMIRSLGHRPPAINRMDYFLIAAAASSH